MSNTMKKKSGEQKSERTLWQSGFCWTRVAAGWRNRSMPQGQRVELERGWHVGAPGIWEDQSWEPVSQTHFLSVVLV